MAGGDIALAAGVLIGSTLATVALAVRFLPSRPVAPISIPSASWSTWPLWSPRRLPQDLSFAPDGPGSQGSSDRQTERPLPRLLCSWRSWPAKFTSPPIFHRRCRAGDLPRRFSCCGSASRFPVGSVDRAGTSPHDLDARLRHCSRPRYRRIRTQSRRAPRSLRRSRPYLGHRSCWRSAPTSTHRRAGDRLMVWTTDPR
jgi:hypothetical protein